MKLSRIKIKIRSLTSQPIAEQSDTTLLDRHNSLRTLLLKKLDTFQDKRLITHLYALLEVERELTLRENQ